MLARPLARRMFSASSSRIVTLFQVMISNTGRGGPRGWFPARAGPRRSRARRRDVRVADLPRAQPREHPEGVGRPQIVGREPDADHECLASAMSPDARRPVPCSGTARGSDRGRRQSAAIRQQIGLAASASPSLTLTLEKRVAGCRPSWPPPTSRCRVDVRRGDVDDIAGANAEPARARAHPSGARRSAGCPGGRIRRRTGGRRTRAHAAPRGARSTRRRNRRRPRRARGHVSAVATAGRPRRPQPAVGAAHVRRLCRRSSSVVAAGSRVDGAMAPASVVRHPARSIAPESR